MPLSTIAEEIKTRRFAERQFGRAGMHEIRHDYLILLSELAELTATPPTEPGSGLTTSSGDTLTTSGGDEIVTT